MTDTATLTQLIVEFYDKLSSWEHCVVRDKGLTLPQVHALEILGTHNGLRMKELAQRMGITTGTLTVLVDRLEKGDMVKRVPHEKDRRSIIVELTEKGYDIFQEHDELHAQLTDDITAKLTDDELAALASILKKLNSEF